MGSVPSAHFDPHLEAIKSKQEDILNEVEKIVQVKKGLSTELKHKQIAVDYMKTTIISLLRYTRLLRNGNTRDPPADAEILCALEFAAKLEKSAARE
jgi:hypothetical protein